MKIEKQLVDFSETGSFSDIFLDYVGHTSKLKSFYQYTPELLSFKQTITDIQKQSFDRQLLVDVINQQYQHSAIKTQYSALLLKENTFTVCTGHQLCLFTGPLYFIYKTITTINLAEELKKTYPEYNFVPVYWMASEDHDFEEISSVNIFGKKVEWKKETVENNGLPAVGNLKTESLKSNIDELKLILGESEHAKKIIDLFNDAYLKNKNLADATRYLVHQLFGEYGLVIIDPNNAQLKTEFTSIIKDDIFNNINHKLVNGTLQQLAQLGYKAQVNPREINVFYMTGEARERIVFEDNKYKIPGLKLAFTKEELGKEIESYPEKFSPNVVLRPLYQQKILPNLAYIGGPAEIAYWLQYKTMFDHHKILFPILIPRNSSVWIDENTSQQITKLDMQPTDLFKSSDMLIKDFLGKNASQSISLEKEENELKAIYQNIASKAEKIDPTLKPSVEGEMQKQLNALKNIEGKIIRAEKQKHENSINKIKKLKEKLFPDNALQERHDNFIPFYLKHDKDFISYLKSNLSPLVYKFHIIRES